MTRTGIVLALIGTLLTVASACADTADKAYSLGTKSKGNTHLWEVTEQRVRASKERLKKNVAAELPADDAERTAQALNRWSRRQAEMLVDLLRELK